MRRIIFVDDDRISTFLLSNIFDHLGIEGERIAFLSGNLFLEWLECQPYETEEILLFLDIMMPEMDGWQVMESLKGHRTCQKIFVIMVSSSLDPNDRKRALQNELVLEYIEKPVKVEDLEKLRIFLT